MKTILFTIIILECLSTDTLSYKVLDLDTQDTAVYVSYRDTLQIGDTATIYYDGSVKVK